MRGKLHTRADFDTWLAAQPGPDHEVSGYRHAVFMRWCASVLAAGGRIDLDEATTQPSSSPTAEAAVAPIESLELLPASLPAPEGPLVAYTDGSGTTADRACGAGVVVYLGSEVILEASRHLGLGTNNHAELSAIRVALAITDTPDLRGLELVIRSDSEYAIDCLTRTEGPHPAAKNARLISLVRAAMRGRRVRVEWVKGHSGVAGNERADELAGLARRRGINPESRAA